MKKYHALMERQQLLTTLADRIMRMTAGNPLRVAIDGVDGAGKTWMADELAAIMGKGSRQIIRASVDGFHRPRAERYRLGRESGEGFYKNSYDYGNVTSMLLRPLGPGGDMTYRRAAFDHRTDSRVDAAPETAEPDAILLMDGIFLQRPELRGLWDLTIFLDVPFGETVRRAIERDLREGSTDDMATIEARYRSRYVAGQELYFSDAQPKERADILIDNTDPADPEIMRL